ncbi:MAG TPA: hypothetical protein VFO27_00705 [Bryobacteraceae bacterium]|nr:hypothetical protein [Bryobacteraceae bacterium]
MTVQKTSALVWIVGGCGALVVLAAIAGGLTMYYLAHKAKQFAHGVGRNPALAAAKMMAAINPDVEVVSTDEDKGTITVRDKKTGKLLTMNLQDAQKGKFVFEQDGQKVEVQAHGEGDKGSLELKSSEGSMKLGTDGKMPDWLPAYPGTAPKSLFSTQTPKGASGSFGFTTNDSIEQVTRYYEDALKKAGLTVKNQTIQSDGKTSMGIVTAEEAGNKRTVMVNATPSEGATSVAITFSAQP